MLATLGDALSSDMLGWVTYTSKPPLPAAALVNRIPNCPSPGLLLETVASRMSCATGAADVPYTRYVYDESSVNNVVVSTIVDAPPATLILISWLPRSLS